MYVSEATFCLRGPACPCTCGCSCNLGSEPFTVHSGPRIISQKHFMQSKCGIHCECEVEIKENKGVHLKERYDE